MMGAFYNAHVSELQLTFVMNKSLNNNVMFEGDLSQTSFCNLAHKELSSFHALFLQIASLGSSKKGDLGDKAPLFGADGKVVESAVKISPLGSNVCLTITNPLW